MKQGIKLSFISKTLDFTIKCYILVIRMLVTGMHIVADINCIDCHSLLGWKYKEAHEESQKYKEGHYILEESKITYKPLLIQSSEVNTSEATKTC